MTTSIPRRVFFNRLSDRVLVPDAIPGRVLDKIGLPKHKRVQHEGLKEEVYLRSFVRDPSFRERFARENALEIDQETTLVVLRPAGYDRKLSRSPK
jgi:predicted glycosyltransferase